MALLTLWGQPGAASAQTDATTTMLQNALVDIQLVADARAIGPGETFRLGVWFSIAESWHINWRNPGDAGLSPGIQWNLPDGFKASPVEWPCPERYAFSSLAIFGYANSVLLAAEVTAPDEIRQETQSFSVDVSWLACQDECIPGEGSASLDVAVATATVANQEAKALFDETAARYPAPSGTWTIEAWYRDDYELYIDVQSNTIDAAPPADVFFFPLEGGVIESAEPQTLSAASVAGVGGFRLTVKRPTMYRVETERLTGVLVSSTGWAGQSACALAVDVPLEARP